MAQEVLAGRASENTTTPAPQQDRLTEETIEQQARTLIQNERYLRAKTKTERRIVASNLLKALSVVDKHDRWQIEDLAEELYQVEVVPRLEQEIIDKVKAYLKTSTKPTQTEVARQLKMDPRRLGPFWEQAKSEL